MKSLPFSDPLLILRKLLFVYLAVDILLSVGQVLALGEEASAFYLPLLVLARVCFIAGLVLAILPSRKPDIIYLRSFRNDSAIEGIRRLIEVASSPLRVAGIRDPGRRIPMFLRPLLETVLLWTYASNRRMNLEAGRDWRLRLTASLCDVRGVIVDYRYPTESLRQELQICTEQLSANRLLFVTAKEGDLSAANISADAVVLEAPTQTENFATFAKKVSEFVDALPSTFEEPNPKALELAVAMSPPDETIDTEYSRLQYIAGWIAVMGIFILASFVGTAGEVVVDIFAAILIVASFLCPLLWIRETLKRRTLRKDFAKARIGTVRRFGLLLFPAALIFGCGAFYAQAFKSHQGYQQRSDSLEAFWPVMQTAKMVFAEYYLDKGHAPTDTEFQALMGGATNAGAKAKIEGERIRITVTSNTEGVGKYIDLVPIVSDTGITYQCTPSDDFPRKQLPRSLCN